MTLSVHATVDAVKKLQDSGVDAFPVSKYDLETEELYEMNSESQQLLVLLC